MVATRGPLVSVVMPMRDAQAYVTEAVRSIVGQSHTDLQVIVVDDGSSDRSCAIVENFADSRIEVLRLGDGGGIVAALNHGFAAADGEFVARMDADDISHPHRLEQQVAFLRGNPDVAACGTWARTIDETGRRGRLVRTPSGREAVGWWRPPPIIHPTAMVRASVAGPRPYRDHAHCEDYELWSRLRRDHRIDNIPRPLLAYRRHRGSTSSNYREAQLQATYEVFREYVPDPCTADEFRAMLGLPGDVPLRRWLTVRRGLDEGRWTRAAMTDLVRYLARRGE